MRPGQFPTGIYLLWKTLALQQAQLIEFGGATKLIP
jgi:hypothetical protein